MKTIKILALTALFTLTFSCNKKENSAIESTTEQSLDSATTSHDGHNHDEENGENAMLKEAQSKPLTNIVLTDSEYSFGDIKKGEKVKHVYEITNTGSNPLIISAVKPTCGCTAPEYTKDPILPGQKGQITLEFDSTNFDGSVFKTAEVYANVEKAPIQLSFTANIIP